MKKILFMIALLLLAATASAVDLSQSFRGVGEWSSSMNLGTASSEMAGRGNMSYAAQATFSPEGSVLKSGLEFTGSRGMANIQGSLGDVRYGLLARDASSISLRSSVDTTAREETQDSVLGELLLYNAKFNGVINGSMKEVSTNGLFRGRPVGLSMLQGIGLFELNSTLRLNQYEVIKHGGESGSIAQ